MQTRNIGPLNVSAVGLGCMGMSYAYGGADEKDAIAALRRAVELGVTHFDTAEAYGPFANEELLAKALAPVKGRVVVATKFGFRFKPGVFGSDSIDGTDGRPEKARAVAEASLKRLGVEVLDLFYLHRVDPAVPVEESVGAMAELVKAGKVRAIGLSEVSATTLRRAHAVHPIAALQSEYSLWSRDAEKLFPTLRELGVAFVPFSPLGRGLLADAPPALAQNDWRRALPRFQAEAMAANERLLAKLRGLAKDKGVTAAQLALAWVLAQGDFIAPIPGARKIAHIEQNVAAAKIVLSPADLAAIAQAGEGVTGERYTAAMAGMVDRD
jgi:aryl-alcohol dehydrogenase-like predicted oxidoreductase